MKTKTLIPEEKLKQLPALYSQDSLGDKAIVHIKLYCPTNGWEWYLSEFDPASRQFFGLVRGFEAELGYTSLGELEALGDKIHYDAEFVPCELGKIR